MLKSWLLMLVPNWMALSARSWPIRPLIGIQFIGGLEAELAGIDHPPQLGSLQRLRARRSGRHLAAAPACRSVLLRTLEKHAITHGYTTPGGTIGASGPQEKIARVVQQQMPAAFSGRSGPQTGPAR